MDPGPAFVAAAGLLGLSAVVHLVARLVADGQLTRNGAIGLRTRATQSSDAAWLAGHAAAHSCLRAAVRTGAVCGGVSLLLSVVLRAAGRASAVPLAVALLGVLAVVVLLVVGARRADAAARLVAD